jgi:hypothetical protein
MPPQAAPSLLFKATYEKYISNEVDAVKDCILVHCTHYTNHAIFRFCSEVPMQAITVKKKLS